MRFRFTRIFKGAVATALAGVCLGLAAAGGDSRIAVPDAPAQAKAERLVHDIFKKEYLDPQHRRVFAATLFKNAVETNDDPAAKYVLFRESRDQAVALGELEPALKASDALGEAFAVDRAECRMETLRKVWAAAPVNGAVAKPFIDLCLKSSEQAAGDEDFGVAGKYGSLAEEFARKVRDTTAVGRARDWNTLLRETAAEAEKARAAYKKLETEPKNTEAKATIARWLCCWREDWDAGLPFLAASGVGESVQLARRDIAGAADSSAAFELAGAWWTFSEKSMQPWSVAAQARAAYWYGKAAPLLTGLSKALAEKRISEASEAVGRNPKIRFNSATKRTTDPK
jgi:hypothetical protein